MKHRSKIKIFVFFLNQRLEISYDTDLHTMFLPSPLLDDDYYFSVPFFDDPGCI